MDGFDHPRIDLEQYPTPAELAASIIHFADLRGDIAKRCVLDLGSGPGIFAIGAGFRNPTRVIGLEIDAQAIDIAVNNCAQIRPPISPEWVRGNAMNPPICTEGEATVFMNPPFGAQRGNVHADRAFLRAAIPLARVTYSIHNAGSSEFMEAFTADNEGEITDIVSMEMDLSRQFDFHELDETSIQTELYRTVWED